jgi:hypothetical protein
MIRRLAVAALVLMPALSGSALPASAQTVAGRLLDGETGLPLAGGSLSLFTDRGETMAEATSGEDGSFVLEAPDRGSYYLAAELEGYADVAEGMFDLGPGGRLEVEVYMRPSPIELEGIDVRTRIVRASGRRRGSRWSGTGSARSRATAGSSIPSEYVTPARRRPRS